MRVVTEPKAPVFLRADGTLTGNYQDGDVDEAVVRLNPGDTVEITIPVKIHTIERMEGDSYTPAFTAITYAPHTIKLIEGVTRESEFTLELPDKLEGDQQITVGVV